MKKSFWGVMLTLAALVMMLGASSAFAYNSKDVTVDLTSSDIVSISGDVSTLTFKDAYGIGVSGDVNDDGTNNISTDIVSAAVTSTVMKSQTVVVYVEADKPGKLGLKDAKVGGTASKVAPVIYDVVISTDNSITGIKTTAHTGSLDVSATSKDSYAVIFYSGDKASNDTYIVVLTVSGDLATSQAGGGAFVSADFALTVDTDLGTVTPTKFTLTPTSSSQTVTLDEGLAGETISFDISSDVKLLKVTTGTIVSSTDKTAKVTVTAPEEDSADVTFKFASGDENGSFDVTVKLVISSDSSIITEDSDYGSFTLTPANATSTTAVSVVSTDYAKALCESADATATALTKSGSFTAEDVTTFTLTFKATDGEDGSISIADVYDVSDTSDIVSVSDDVLKSNVITPAVAGSYRILFKAAPEDETADAEYFTVNFTLAESDSGDEDTPIKIDDSTLTDSSKAVSDFNNSTSGAVSESDIAALDSDTSIEGRALKAAYADFFDAAGVKTLAELLEHVPTTGGFTYPQYALMKLTTAPAEGATIIVRLMTASAIGAAPTSSSTTYAGTFVSKAASQYIIIDTYNLRQPSTPTSTLTLPEGIYAILAQIYTSASTESVSIAATADGMARLDAEGYSGNVASKITGSNKGSSSGCDAGFGALALLALALPLVKKFSK